jgi:hypothetical protein
MTALRFDGPPDVLKPFTTWLLAYNGSKRPTTVDIYYVRTIE